MTERHFVSREIEVAAMLTSTSTITQNTTLSGISQWSDPNSDPKKAIKDAAETIRDSIMVDPNTLMLSKKVFNELADHPALVERVKYSQLGILTADLLARFFEVDRVIIGAAKKNTSKEGQADSMSDIWGRDALLAFINPRLGQKTVSLGVTYQWKSRTTERLNGTDVRALAETVTAEGTFLGRFVTKMRKGITLLTSRADRAVLQSRAQDDPTPLATKNDRTIL
ncbi:hypothetical protein [Nitrobacter sp. TKz-YC02]|uniref:major capsid protein n=1 Tax=Nitrobacter sp. TKz-YC02 TaxID=3398704 RepID=UPI003CEE57C7